MDDMNETHDVPPPEDPGFDASKARTLTDMTRATDDRLIAGVSAGVGRHLGIDPVVVRIVFVALTFVGLSGLILYAAAWFLLPSDDGTPSIAADWFRLDRNEPQVRTVGLIVAAVLAAGAIVGDSGWFWWSFPWIIIPLAVLFWLFVVLPRRRRATGSFTRPGGTPTTGGPPPGTPVATQPGGWSPTATTVTAPPAPRTPRRAPLLLLLTLSSIAVALGSLRVWAESTGTTVEWTTYTAVAIGLVGLGLLVGAWWGGSWTLPLVGLVAVGVLALSTALPSARIGDDRHSPRSAAAVESEYSLGLGRLELDLSNVRDVDALRGRTVEISHGVGETVVIVPRDLPVTVNADIRGGAIEVFGRQSAGGSADLTVRADDLPALTLDIDQTFGHIVVVRS